MTNYLLITLTSVLLSSQNIFNKEYQRRAGTQKNFLFVTYTSLAAFVFYLVYSRLNLSFDAGILPYSVAFGISYGTTFIATLAALRTGSLALTNLVTSFSLLLPTAYGLIFLDEDFGVFMLVGVVLLAVSIVLLNIQTGNKSVKKEKLSLKWVIFAGLAFLGNGMCSIIQNMQQRKFEGDYKNETMMVAVLISALIFFVGAVVNGELKAKATAKDNALCGVFGALTGFANGGLNMLVMVLTGGIVPLVSLSLFFPGLSALSMVIAFFVSLLIYRERFTKCQIAGYIVAVFSVIFLNM